MSALLTPLGPSVCVTCEVLDACVAAAPAFKAHSIAHLSTQLTATLLSHTPRHSHSTLCVLGGGLQQEQLQRVRPTSGALEERLCELAEA